VPGLAAAAEAPVRDSISGRSTPRSGQQPVGACEFGTICLPVRLLPSFRTDRIDIRVYYGDVNGERL